LDAFAEIDRISRAIATAVVEADFETPQAAFVLLLEFGRRNIALQLSKRGWNLVLGYRRWPPPLYTEPPAYAIKQVGVGPLTLTVLGKSVH
jgi:hypothetical protein